MNWYEQLYTSDNIKKNRSKYQWKLEHGAGMVNMYVICLGEKEDEQLNIFSTAEFMRNHHEKDQPFIIGMARGYDNTLDLIEQIAWDVYNETGNGNIRKYFLQNINKDME